MIVGILSDSHGRSDIMSRGINALRDMGAQYFVHCGDIGGEECVDLLAGLSGGFVWGNTDWDRPRLQRYALSVGVQCFGEAGEIDADGKSIVVLHGDDAARKQRLLAEQRHDYLMHGHTHVQLDTRVGRVRVINPGALHRAAEKTVAVLDTTTDALRFIVVR